MAAATLSNRWLLALLLVIAELIALSFMGLVVQALGQSTVAGVFQMFGFVTGFTPAGAIVYPANAQKMLGSPRAFALTTLGLAGILLLAFFFVRFTTPGY